MRQYTQGCQPPSDSCLSVLVVADDDVDEAMIPYSIMLVLFDDSFRHCCCLLFYLLLCSYFVLGGSVSGNGNVWKC